MYAIEIHLRIDTIAEKELDGLLLMSNLHLGTTFCFVSLVHLSYPIDDVIIIRPCCADSVVFEESIRDIVVDEFRLTNVQKMLLDGMIQNRTIVSGEYQGCTQPSNFSYTHEAEW
jgi:hypothetical protein